MSAIEPMSEAAQSVLACFRAPHLEHGIATPDGYKKVNYDGEAIDRLLVDLWREAHAPAPEEVILDLDTTDVALHGHQREPLLPWLLQPLLLFATLHFFR